MSDTQSRATRHSRASAAARSRFAKILLKTMPPGSAAASSSFSIYTNPYDHSSDSASPPDNRKDLNWRSRRLSHLPLSVAPGSEMATPMDNVRRWCAVTYTPWKESEGKAVICNRVQEAHVVDKNLNIIQKARLEVAWGLKPEQFDFNSPLNTIPLQVDWHMRFDKQDWVLLPDVHVLVQIHSAAQDHLRTAGARKAADEGVPLLKGNALDYKIHQYVFVPFGPSSASAKLFRLKFKEGNEYEELAKREFISYTPDAYSKWPKIESTAHPYPIIWKAVREFGLHSPLSRLSVPSQRIMMTMAREIYTLWQEYADDHRELWSYLDPDGSPSPSYRGRPQQTHTSLGKRKRGRQDGGGDEKRSRKPSSPGESADRSGDVVDDVPGLVSHSKNDSTPSSPYLQSPSLIDRPVRVAAEEDSESESEDEGRPIALQPKRQFSITDWANAALEHGEPVAEDHYSPNPQFFEEPRKPPSGPWEDWPPAYA